MILSQFCSKQNFIFKKCYDSAKQSRKQQLFQFIKNVDDFKKQMGEINQKITEYSDQNKLQIQQDLCMDQIFATVNVHVYQGFKPLTFTLTDSTHIQKKVQQFGLQYSLGQEIIETVAEEIRKQLSALFQQQENNSGRHSKRGLNGQSDPIKISRQNTAEKRKTDHHAPVCIYQSPINRLSKIQNEYDLMSANVISKNSSANYNNLSKKTFPQQRQNIPCLSNLAKEEKKDEKFQMVSRKIRQVQNYIKLDHFQPFQQTQIYQETALKKQSNTSFLALKHNQIRTTLKNTLQNKFSKRYSFENIQ